MNCSLIGFAYLGLFLEGVSHPWVSQVNSKRLGEILNIHRTYLAVCSAAVLLVWNQCCWRERGQSHSPLQLSAALEEHRALEKSWSCVMHEQMNECFVHLWPEIMFFSCYHECKSDYLDLYGTFQPSLLLTWREQSRITPCQILAKWQPALLGKCCIWGISSSGHHPQSVENAMP